MPVFPAEKSTTKDIVKYLNENGYECNSDPAGINARTKRPVLNIHIKFLNDGILFTSVLNIKDNQKSKTEEIYSLVNDFNLDAVAIRYYVDRDLDVLVEAFFPGQFDKFRFSTFVTKWETEFISLVGEKRELIQKYIK